MAQDAADRVKYYLTTGRDNDNDLARIRHWSNLKIGYDEGSVWLKDLDYAQINSVEIKSLPSKTLYYEKDGRLFLLHSLLPDRIAPSLLWTPIDRGLQVTLPSFNHNYFGLHEHIDIRFVSQDQEADAVALIVDMKILKSYMETAPGVRLEKIRWVILNDEKALLLGKPLLPLPGVTFWQRKDMLIPTGLDFELFILADTIQKSVNPGRDNWILWNTDASYFNIRKEDLQPLSRSSFRQTYQQLKQGSAQ
jgi:hypothetical protein